MHIDRLIDSDFEDSEETMWDNWHHYASRIRSWRIWVLSWWHMCSWAKTGCYRNLQSGGNTHRNLEAAKRIGIQHPSSRVQVAQMGVIKSPNWGFNDRPKLIGEITQTIIRFGMLLFPSSTWLEHPSGPPFHRCTWPAKDGWLQCLPLCLRADRCWKRLLGTPNLLGLAQGDQLQISIGWYSNTYFWPYGWAIAVACWIEQIHQEQGQFLHWHLCRHCQNSNAYKVVAPVPSWIHAIDCRYIYICTNRKPIVSLCFHLWHCLETK